MRSAGAMLLVLLLAGCGAGAGSPGGPPTPAQTHTHTLVGATTCGTPYTFEADGTTVSSGSCAGLISATPPRLTVRRGERFSVEITHEQNGRLDFPVPQPTSGAVSLVGRHGPRANYVGHALGTARLVAHRTRFCENIDPRIGNCAALAVRVVAH